MKRIGHILAAAAMAVAARFAGLARAAESGAGPARAHNRRPEPITRRGRLVWDSNRLGAAYRAHDAQGRLIYIPLKSVPPAKRTPRRVRKTAEWSKRAA